MPDLIVRRAVDADLPQILETLKAALGETPLLRRTSELWAWKHIDNPFGRSMILVADAQGRIAGVRAMMRWELVTPQGATLRCLRPVDTATHPEFMRSGVFRRLTTAAVDEAKSAGIDLIFNTPNEKSAPGYLKMGWRPIADLDALVRPRLGASARVRHDTPPSIEQLAPDLESPNRFDLEDRPPRGLRTLRSETYLNWRFGSHPTASYGVLRDDGGVVVARANSRGRWSEVVVSDLLGGADSRSIKQLARLNRARYIAGWFSPGTPERRSAIRGGMFPIPRRTLRLVALPIVELETDVFDMASWDLATSDLELL
ncbi:MAG TPA: GNAT family N-acetyltransferase [Acidimicrobiia bacterium]|nr:GNAT family N-acetyltransferase [Acidimicrobiia bacterium]